MVLHTSPKVAFQAAFQLGIHITSVGIAQNGCPSRAVLFAGFIQSAGTDVVGCLRLHFAGFASAVVDYAGGLSAAIHHLIAYLLYALGMSCRRGKSGQGSKSKQVFFHNFPYMISETRTDYI